MGGDVDATDIVRHNMDGKSELLPEHLVLVLAMGAETEASVETERFVKDQTISRISMEYKAREHEEPILKGNPRRWVMFPSRYPEIWEMYKEGDRSVPGHNGLGAAHRLRATPHQARSCILRGLGWDRSVTPRRR